MANRELERHLAELFSGAEDAGLRFLVCSKRDFAGSWCATVGDAIATADRESASSDVYVGVGLRRVAPPPGHRGNADEIDGLVGLWLDVDVAGVAHAKKKLPASIEAARELLAAVFPVCPPSLVVFSGHGIQGWWLFSEPWVFSSPEERRAAQEFMERYRSTVRAVTTKRGVAVDSVFDLSRVFRVAGTWNRKTETPIATRLDIPREGDRVLRYERDDLEACFVADEAVGDRGIPVDPLILTADRRPPEDALLSLLTNHDKARATWEGKRPDLADQSGSSLDFSLAVIAVRFGWSDQEVADLLIARRRKAGDDLKTTKRGILRLDYYQRTILAAKKVVADERDTKAYESDDEPPLTANGKPIDDSARVKIFEKARGVFGLPITRFVQNGEGRDARFSFRLADGGVLELGGPETLERQSVIRALVYAAVRRYPKSLKVGAWARMFEDLGGVCEVVENPESGRDGRFAALMFEYLSDKTASASASLRSGDDWGRSVVGGDPFVRDGRLFVSTTSIERYVRAVYSRPTDVRELWEVLAEWGFTNTPVKTRLGARQIARRYWSAPIDELTERRGFVLPIAYTGSSGVGAEGAPGRGGEGDAGQGGAGSTPSGQPGGGEGGER